MGLGTSIFLIAVGAILDFGVETNVTGFNIHAVGVILMLIGVLGAVLSLFFWSSWGGFGRRRTTVYDDPAYYGPPATYGPPSAYGAPATRRRRIVEEDIR